MSLIGVVCCNSINYLQTQGLIYWKYSFLFTCSWNIGHVKFGLGKQAILIILRNEFEINTSTLIEYKR